MKIVILVFVLTMSKVLSADISISQFEQALVDAAVERTNSDVVYDGSYYAIPYPNGDVPENIGVCTDVIIRTYRKLGIDLQKLVHEDISSHFDSYPSKRIWGLTRPDKNIDHRRVPNLQTYFTRHGESLLPSLDHTKYLPGDIVSWSLAGNLPHIGIVIDQQSAKGIPLIVHNIGQGPQIEDVLFNYRITGHYRFNPKFP